MFVVFKMLPYNELHICDGEHEIYNLYINGKFQRIRVYVNCVRYLSLLSLSGKFIRRKNGFLSYPGTRITLHPLRTFLIVYDVRRVYTSIVHKHPKQHPPRALLARELLVSQRIPINTLRRAS